jgi:hypothetical protein
MRMMDIVDGGIVQCDDERQSLHVADISCNGFHFPFAGAPSTYPILLHPLATSFHSGKIKCKLIVNTDISSAGCLHVIGTVNRNGLLNGEAVGCQGYLTAVKNTKGAATFRKLSKVGQIEKASFGLLHSSLENEHPNIHN